MPPTTSTAPATVHTLEVPGARLHVEVRGRGPVVLLVGAPMDAGAFAPLADLLAVDHTVVTTDPRGINRSPVDDPDLDVTVELRADDLAAILTDLVPDAAGAATVLGSSGGAVSVLALAQTRPELVGVVIAHEPPLYDVVEDRDDLHRKGDAMVATYLDGDRVGAWRQFMAAADIELPEEVFQMMFGAQPEPQALADEHTQFAHMLLPTVRWMPDVDVLRSIPARIVVGIGEASGGQFCERASEALAAALGVEPTRFPGGHVGFAEDPAAFATRLRAVLASR